VIVAQEINIDYNASSPDAFIDGNDIEKAQSIRPGDVDSVGKWIIGVDAAHFGNDEHIIHKRKGRLNLEQVARRGVDGLQLAGLVEEECRTLEAAGGEIHAIVIELDGPGVSCFDQLRQGPYARYVQGVHTGARLSDNSNYNVRARMWRRARDYLKDYPISMSNTSTRTACC
jgi:phage terminase large subunit